jgi:hypothetical protein
MLVDATEHLGQAAELLDHLKAEVQAINSSKLAPLETARGLPLRLMNEPVEQQ